LRGSFYLGVPKRADAGQSPMRCSPPDWCAVRTVLHAEQKEAQARTLSTEDEWAAQSGIAIALSEPVLHPKGIDWSRPLEHCPGCPSSDSVSLGMQFAKPDLFHRRWDEALSVDRPLGPRRVPRCAQQSVGSHDHGAGLTLGPYRRSGVDRIQKERPQHAAGAFPFGSIWLRNSPRPVLARRGTYGQNLVAGFLQNLISKVVLHLGFIVQLFQIGILQ